MGSNVLFHKAGNFLKVSLKKVVSRPNGLQGHINAFLERETIGKAHDRIFGDNRIGPSLNDKSRNRAGG